MDSFYISSDEPDELLKVDNLVMDAVWLLEIEKSGPMAVLLMEAGDRKMNPSSP